MEYNLPLKRMFIDARAMEDSPSEEMTTMQAISRFLAFILWCIYQLAGWLSLLGFLEFKVLL
jgi:hypothetical protein